jgi:hypothetical protein
MHIRARHEIMVRNLRAMYFAVRHGIVVLVRVSHRMERQVMVSYIIIRHVKGQIM